LIKSSFGHSRAALRGSGPKNCQHEAGVGYFDVPASPVRLDAYSAEITPDCDISRGETGWREHQADELESRHMSVGRPTAVRSNQTDAGTTGALEIVVGNGKRSRE